MSKLDRSEIFAKYLIDNKSTVRDTAKYFGISKSTVHNDLKHKLPNINMRLYRKAKKVMDYNYTVKHIRGGEATALKYKKVR